MTISKQFMLILIIWIVSRSSQDENIECEPPWKQFQSLCLQFVKDKPYRTWHGARNECKRRGGVIPSSYNTLQRMIEMYRVLYNNWYLGDAIECYQWWIGLRQVNDTWLTVDNIPLSNVELTNFKLIGEQDDYDDQCAVYDLSSFNTAVRHCNDAFPFICEKVKESTSTEGQHESNTTTSTSTKTPDETDSSLTLYVIVAVSTSAVVLLIGGACAVYIYRRRRQNYDNDVPTTTFQNPHYVENGSADADAASIINVPAGRSHKHCIVL